MYHYRIYGMYLAADLEFPQLLEDEAWEERKGGGALDIIFREGCVAAQIPPHDSAGQCGFGAQISWLENKTCYLLVEDGCRITYQRKDGAREMYLRSYLLGWGMSMLSHQRGEPAIHCSAVCSEDGVVLLCGESGSGKSTMTAALLEQGYRLMADDMALVEYRSAFMPVLAICFSGIF